MNNILMYVWLLVGFFLLIKGADLFVDGTSSIAKASKSTKYNNRTDYCCYGNQRAGDGGKRGCSYKGSK